MITVEATFRYQGDDDHHGYASVSATAATVEDALLDAELKVERLYGGLYVLDSWLIDQWHPEKEEVA